MLNTNKFRKTTLRIPSHSARNKQPLSLDDSCGYPAAHRSAKLSRLELTANLSLAHAQQYSQADHPKLYDAAKAAFERYHKQKKINDSYR